jgi:hypothetical protein
MDAQPQTETWQASRRFAGAGLSRRVGARGSSGPTVPPEPPELFALTANGFDLTANGFALKAQG